MSPKSVTISKLTTLENFQELPYLLGNPVVARAVREGAFPSGRAHFERHLQRHGDKIPLYMRFPDLIAPLRKEKMKRLDPVLRKELYHVREKDTYNFLSESLKEQHHIIETANISAHPYDAEVLSLISEFEDGLVLDCGSGRRNEYFSNVVNFEIVDYDTTDIIGVGEDLPFADNSFDAVLSLAVLEHVRNPFRCAAEIVRVIKPGGRLHCLVPFLQPEHGYPHHYYNMAPQGLRALFEDFLEITEHSVTDFIGPIHALVWILASWSKGLEGETKENFLNMKVSDFLIGAKAFHRADFVQALPVRKKFELACGTRITAVKPRNASQMRQGVEAVKPRAKSLS